MYSSNIRWSSVNILGVNVSTVTVSELHAEIRRLIDTQTHALVLHANVYALNIAYSKPWFRDLFNSAHLVFCDGAGVRWGARLLGKQIPARITYADWMWDLAGFCSQHAYTLFFLGARPGVAEQAALRLRDRYPDLKIVGVHDGYFDKNLRSLENESCIQEINAANPHILVVGFGMPLQEKWLDENWHQINANIALTGGAVFDYISGELRRAPRWMTDNGFEWLGRLLIEPFRLWKRYLIGNPLFLWRVLKQKFDLHYD